MDTDTNDIVSNGFGNTLTRDGQGSATANLPMNGFRHTGAGNGVARSDYAALGQVEDGVINWAVATGTADAIAASQSPNVAALVDGQLSFFRATAANATTTPTYSLNGLTARTITKTGGTALAVGDIPGNLAECVLRYNLANTRWELLNPASGVVGPGSAVDGHLAVFSGVMGKIIKDGGAFSVAAAQLAGSAIPFGVIMVNGTIVQSQAANAQTFAIKTLAGADPSAGDPTYFLFRDVTAATGDYVVRTVTAALSITIPSGQAMGFSNATPGRVWIGALDNGGTVELFVLNALLSGNGTYPLQGWGIISTSAVSGASSSGVAYSTASRSNKAYVPLGYAVWETGGTLGTAGTWNVAPSRLQLFQPGSVPLPGTPIQIQPAATTTAGTSTSTTYVALTTGQTVVIAPTSSANPIRVQASGTLNQSGAGASGALQLSRGVVAATNLFGSVADALNFNSGGPITCPSSFFGYDFPATTSSTTYAVQGKASAGTLTFGGAGLQTAMEATEIMA